MESPYSSEEERTRLLDLYRDLHSRIHSSSRPLKLIYHVAERETLLAWVGTHTHTHPHTHTTHTLTRGAHHGPSNSSTTLQRGRHWPGWVHTHTHTHTHTPHTHTLSLT